MKLMLNLLTLLLPLALWSQDSTTTYPKNQVKLNAFKLIDPYNPGIELGYERKVNDYISVHIAGAQLTNLIIKPYQKYDGHRLTFELKYIHKTLFKYMFIVPSVSFVQNKMEITTNKSFARDTGLNGSKWTSQTYEDTFSIKKTTWAINLNGSVLIPYRSFAFEYILGFGAKNRNVIHSDRLYPGDPFRPNRHNSEAYAYLRAGTYYTFSMAMAIRVGIRF